MHELSLAQALVEQMEEVAQGEKATRIIRVVVEIGVLAGIEYDAFELAFPFAAEDTLAEGAELVINRVPAKAICNACKISFEPEIIQLTCPACGSFDVSLTGGREFLIRSIELEVD